MRNYKYDDVYYDMYKTYICYINNTRLRPSKLKLIITTTYTKLRLLDKIY